MAQYDIAGIYEEMEKHLLDSMARNLMRHAKEEAAYGFKWEQWQAAKLREMRKFRKHNQKIIGQHTKNLPKHIKQHLENEFKQGLIGEAKKHKAKFDDKTIDLSDGFFGTNDKKVQALIDVVNNDLNKANHAAFRRTNDIYRQTVHKAAMYSANGVMTPQQAISKAIQEFKAAGINCIVYSNGAHHRISNYARMAVRTAEMRAMLMGEGKFRQEYGETLVQITKHGTACPLCQPFESKVFIDDVYSGGTWENSKDKYERVPVSMRGKVRLLSEAMAEGLMHPNCRHGAGTFYVELLDDVEAVNTAPLVGIAMAAAHKLVKKDAERVVSEDENWYNKDARSNAGDSGARYATGAIATLQSTDEINQHFMYVDEYGTPHIPFDDQFALLPIETQRELAAGIEYAQQNFNVSTLPHIITSKTFRAETLGKFIVDDGKRIIAFNASLKNKVSEAYPTAIHEMVHYVDDLHRNFAESIYRQALKNLGLRIDAKIVSNLRISIVGLNNKRDWDDYAEILAYAVEKTTMGRGNSLANEITKVFLERVRK